MIKQECPVCHKEWEIEDELGLEELGIVRGISPCPSCLKKVEKGEITDEQFKEDRRKAFWDTLEEMETKGNEKTFL